MSDLPPRTEHTTNDAPATSSLGLQTAPEAQLPSMVDLESLSADLDEIDQTLADLDRRPEGPSAS